MTTVLALTGPVAAGKSTIVGLLEDSGVPCRSTGEAIRERAADEYDDPSEDDVWSVAEDIREERGPQGPTVECSGWINTMIGEDEPVVCISDLREQAEVDYLRRNFNTVLVIRIDAPVGQRIHRYVDREVEESIGVSAERVTSLEKEFKRREEREKPYPDHDVSIQNYNDVHTDDLLRRIGHIIDVVG